MCNQDNNIFYSSLEIIHVSEFYYFEKCIYYFLIHIIHLLQKSL
jgi:hypothetical protein